MSKQKFTLEQAAVIETIKREAEKFNEEHGKYYPIGNINERSIKALFRLYEKSHILMRSYNASSLNKELISLARQRLFGDDLRDEEDDTPEDVTLNRRDSNNLLFLIEELSEYLATVERTCSWFREQSR